LRISYRVTKCTDRASFFSRQTYPSFDGIRTFRSRICRSEVRFSVNWPPVPSFLKDISALTSPLIVHIGQLCASTPVHPSGSLGRIKVDRGDESSTPRIRRDAFNGSETLTRFNAPQPSSSGTLPTEIGRASCR